MALQLAVPCALFLVTAPILQAQAPGTSSASPPSTPPVAAPKPRTAFNALPRGTQKFDGVTFHIQGPVNVIGARAARAGGRELARLGNPSIQGRGKYIHVLHTGDHGASATGNYIWRLVLYYADGESRRFDFAYGVHIRNFWRRANEPDFAPNDPDSAIVWVGTSVESDRTGAELVVSRTTLTNPRPNVEVNGADFVSLLGQSSAYVFAVTVGDDGPRPASVEPRSAPNVPTLTFVFQDAAGRPQTNATLNCIFECNGFSVRLAQALANTAGKITIDVPTEIVSALRYEAREPGGKTETARIEIAPGDKGWRPHVVRFAE